MQTIVQYKSLLAIKVDFKMLTTVVVKRTAALRRKRVRRHISNIQCLFLFSYLRSPTVSPPPESLPNPIGHESR